MHIFRFRKKAHRRDNLLLRVQYYILLFSQSFSANPRCTFVNRILLYQAHTPHTHTHKERMTRNRHMLFSVDTFVLSTQKDKSAVLSNYLVKAAILAT